MKKLYLPLLCLLGAASLSAQDQFTQKELSIQAGPAIGKINNDNISGDPYAVSKDSPGLALALRYNYYFVKNVGLTIGLDFCNYKNTTYYKGVYRDANLSVDRDNYLCYKQYQADYSDTRALSTIDIPLALRVQSYNEKFQAFADIGLKLNIALTSKFTEKGTYENMGAYPIKNYNDQYVLVENNGYYGYARSLYNVNGDLGVNRVTYSFMMEGGIKSKLQDKLFMTVSVAYMKGLADIMDSSRHNDYVRMSQEKFAYKKFTLSQLCLRAGIGICLY